MRKQSSVSTLLRVKSSEAETELEWHCHCCIARNDNADTACRVCNRPRSYANAPHLPLHDHGKYILRSDQLRTLLPGPRLHDSNAKKWTALHSCAAVGNHKLVEELLNQGSEIEATTIEGYTPLHLAAHSGSVETVSVLVVRKANPNAQTFFEKNTPLHIAVKEGWRSIVHYLIDIGANIHIVNAVGRSPLHVAATKGRVDIGTLLLQNHAKFQQMDSQGWTPQQIAEYHNHFDFQEILMRSGLQDSQYKITDIVKGEWDNELWRHVVVGRRQREKDLSAAEIAYDVSSIKTNLALATSQSSTSWTQGTSLQKTDTRPSRGSVLIKSSTIKTGVVGATTLPKTDIPRPRQRSLVELQTSSFSSSSNSSVSKVTARGGGIGAFPIVDIDNVSVISDLSKDGSDGDIRQESKYAAAARRNMV